MRRKSVDMGRRSAEGRRPTIVHTGDAAGPRGSEKEGKLDGDRGKREGEGKVEKQAEEAKEESRDLGVKSTEPGPANDTVAGMALESKSKEASTTTQELEDIVEERRGSKVKEKPAGNTLEDKLKRLEAH